MKTLRFYTGPALIIGLWIAATSFTLSELATVGPSLRSTRLQPPRGRETKHRVLEARAQPGAR